MTAIIYDVECDGLLDAATRVHCVLMKRHRADSGGIFVAEDHLDAAENWRKLTGLFNWKVRPFSRLKISGQQLVAHNQIGYDLPVLKKLLNLDLQATNEIIDTLVMSRYIDPDRPSHGLKVWGERFGIDKVAVESWSEGSIELYLDRCYYDVVINEAVYNALRHEFREPKIRSGFDLAQFTFAEIQQQERTGVVFDVPQAEQLLARLNAEMTAIANEIEPQLGEAPLPKNQQPTFPKRPFKQDGSLAATAWRYGAKIGLTEENAIRESLKKGPFEFTAPIKLGQTELVKEYLYTKLGWKPTIWRNIDITKKNKRAESADRKRKRARKYIKDVYNSPYRDEIWDMLGFPEQFREYYNCWKPIKWSRGVNFITKRGRELPKSPQLCEPVSKTICSNLEKLDSNLAQKIQRWMSLRNRQGVVASWLQHPRLAVDSRLPAGSAGITNTHRQRHHTVVNVPQADGKAIFGKEMRSLFVAPPGLVCVGCDASGLENRIAGHFTCPFDGGAYARILLDGDTHSVNAAAYSESIGRKVTRNESKPVTYAIIYGAGPPKISRMLNISVDMATKLIAAFWSVNLGLKDYRELLEAEWERNGRKFIWGLDGRFIRTRSRHSLVNASFQSAGAIVMDTAWRIARATHLDKLQGWFRWGYFHDEYQCYAEPELADTIGAAMVYGIRQAGSELQLNIPLDGEYKIGQNWAETH